MSLHWSDLAHLHDNHHHDHSLVLFRAVFQSLDPQTWVLPPKHHYRKRRLLMNKPADDDRYNCYGFLIRSCRLLLSVLNELRKDKKTIAKPRQEPSKLLMFEPFPLEATINLANHRSRSIEIEALPLKRGMGSLRSTLLCILLFVVALMVISNELANQRSYSSNDFQDTVKKQPKTQRVGKYSSTIPPKQPQHQEKPVLQQPYDKQNDMTRQLHNSTTHRAVTDAKEITSQVCDSLSRLNFDLILSLPTKGVEIKETKPLVRASPPAPRQSFWEKVRTFNPDLMSLE